MNITDAFLKIDLVLQGRVKFPTGGKVRDFPKDQGFYDPSSNVKRVVETTAPTVKSG